MTKVVAFFDGGAAREAQMAFAGPPRGATCRRRGPRGPPPGGRVPGRDEIASVEKSSIPHLVVGREHHILGL